jgi:hypothetical protein
MTSSCQEISIVVGSLASPCLLQDRGTKVPDLGHCQRLYHVNHAGHTTCCQAGKKCNPNCALDGSSRPHSSWHKARRCHGSGKFPFVLRRPTTSSRNAHHEKNPSYHILVTRRCISAPFHATSSHCSVPSASQLFILPECLWIAGNGKALDQHSSRVARQDRLNEPSKCIKI